MLIQRTNTTAGRALRNTVGAHEQGIKQVKAVMESKKRRGKKRGRGVRRKRY